MRGEEKVKGRREREKRRRCGGGGEGWYI